MKEGRYFLKKFLFFVLMLMGVMIFTVLLLFWIWRSSFLAFQDSLDPGEVYNVIKKSGELDLSNLSEETQEYLTYHNIWGMTLDEEGSITSSYQLPKEVEREYSIQDIVRFTRWYLEDYPVFTYVLDEGVLVLGFPKGSYEKLPVNYFQIEIYSNFLKGLGIVVLVDIGLIFLLYLYSKNKLLKEMGPIREGIEKLSKGESVNLNVKGELSEIQRELNRVSEIIEEDKAQRRRWIRGVSHDLRTPLTLITGYVQRLREKQDNRELKIIDENAVLMENILSSLNLTYSLEEKNLKLEKEKIHLQSFLRKVVANIANASSEGYEFRLDFPSENIYYWGNKTLLERGIRNILLNSVVHNESALIAIMLKEKNNQIELSVFDNGSISKEKVGELNSEGKDSRWNHGYGILITKQIIELHGGVIEFYYKNPGLGTKIIL